MLNKSMERDLAILSVAVTVSVVILLIIRGHVDLNLYYWLIPLAIGAVGYAIVLIRTSKEEHVEVRRKLDRLNQGSARRGLQRGACNAMAAKAAELKVEGACAALIIVPETRMHINPDTYLIGPSLVWDEMNNAGEVIGYNLYSVVQSKIGEMIATRTNSGASYNNANNIHGHYNWQGGVYFQVDGYEFFTAFSGSTGNIDLEIALAGMMYFRKELV